MKLELILIQIKTASAHRSKGCNSFYFLLSSRRTSSFAILGIYFLPAARADRSSNGVVVVGGGGGSGEKKYAP